MIVHRDYDRTEHDDFVLNVEKHIGEHQEAMPIHHPEENYIVAWKIQGSRE